MGNVLVVRRVLEAEVEAEGEMETEEVVEARLEDEDVLSGEVEVPEDELKP